MEILERRRAFLGALLGFVVRAENEGVRREKRTMRMVVSGNIVVVGSSIVTGVRVEALGW